MKPPIEKYPIKNQLIEKTKFLSLIRRIKTYDIFYKCLEFLPVKTIVYV